MKDYRNGCPMCGVRHHKGTTKGFSGMNARCAKRYGRLSDERKAEIWARARSE